MIKTTTRTIHFIPYDPKKGRTKDTEEAPTCTVSAKFGLISFSKKAVDQLQMDGKLVRFFFDSTKKIVGWQVQSKSMELAATKNWKLVKANKTGMAQFSINGILKSFIGLTKDSYKKLEIKKYVVTQGVLEKGQQYYYVKVDEKSSDDDE